MIMTQPVVHELPDITVPTLLIIGQADRTAVGKDRASPAAAARLGQYPELGRRAADVIPDATLVSIEGVGHLPHIAATERFHNVLLDWLAARP